MRRIFGLAISTAILFGQMACSSKESSPTSAATPGNSAYLATSEPAGAVPVGDARKNVQDQEEVVLIGRIGGSEKPFVDGLAAFTIVDPKVEYCADDEGCPTPWDYCCKQDEVKENIAMVKVVDDKGNPLAADARTLLGIKELNLVVVQGKATRDSNGNLSVLADRIFVKN